MKIVKGKRLNELFEKEKQLATVTEGLEELRVIFSIAKLENKNLNPKDVLAKATEIVADCLELPEVNFTLITERSMLPDDVISFTLEHFDSRETTLLNPIRAEGIAQRIIVKTRDKYKIAEFIEVIGGLGYTIEKSKSNWILLPTR